MNLSDNRRRTVTYSRPLEQKNPLLMTQAIHAHGVILLRSSFSGYSPIPWLGILRLGRDLRRERFNTSEAIMKRYGRPGIVILRKSRGMQISYVLCGANCNKKLRPSIT